MKLALLAALTLATATALWLSQPEPACAAGTCIPTFCGFDHDCHPGCHCFIPTGKATGTCG